MTESEWSSCTDARKMLAFLRGKVPPRKLRQFAVAYCRSLYQAGYGPPEGRQAFDTAERFLAGRATQPELDRAYRAAKTTADAADRRASHPDEESADAALALVEACDAATYAAVADPDAQAAAEGVVEHLARDEGRKDPCAVLRDVVSNPFRPVALAHAWLEANDSRVMVLARGIYESGRFADMPLLADALEQAGCSDEAILNHCRVATDHVRECWVVDLCRGTP